MTLSVDLESLILEHEEASAKVTRPALSALPSANDPVLLERARRYIATIESVSGRGGHDACFHAACCLAEGFGLAEGDVRALLYEWNQTCASPPWSGKELEHKLDSALKVAASSARCGYLLTEPTPKPYKAPQPPAAPPCSPEPCDVEPDLDQGFRPFPLDCLPPTVADYVSATAEALQCDPAFVAIPALVNLASCVGATRVIRIKSTWKEPCILWGAVLGKSGTMKSAALEQPLRRLYAIQQQRALEWQQRAKEFEAEQARYMAAMKGWQSAAARGKAEGPPPEAPVPPVCERVIVSDITVESLASRLQDQWRLNRPRGLLLVRDELAGWLGSFNQYKAKGANADAAKWLELHRMGTLIVDRKSGDGLIYVRRACMCICGGIQPGVLSRALGNEHVENGLLARFLLAAPPWKSRVWQPDCFDESLSERFTALVDRLLELDFAQDADGLPVPVEVPLSAAGVEEWARFYNPHAEEMRALDEDYAAAWSKLEGYCGRLALLLHLIRAVSSDPTLTDPASIDADSVRAAAKLTDWFKEEARRIYRNLSASTWDRERDMLVDIARAKGGAITVRELGRACRRYRKPDDARQAIERLVKAGVGKVERVFSGGRPTLIFKASG